ncbi:putative serine/threonine protein kinase [Golden Marseillevirus]|uniref:putative serine/threonine protein kinase n=1 Tax=Golden Marseillevirus TaxID=1720526 RepID=UPI000877AC50|nr:putative serine/threonine protein kinase [Golden Marseillevirus]ALX27602.1 putative serine/threonine protein kinase [Golden Marseillevirus]
MSFKKEGKWLVSRYQLEGAQQKTEAMNDAIITCCFTGTKEVEKEGNTFYISSKGKKSQFILCFVMAKISPTYATFLYEPFSGGTLEAYAPSRDFEFSKAVRLAKHMCKAVAFIHELGVYHRNLTPRSFIIILANKEGKISSTAKLWKFGNCRPLHNSENISPVYAQKTDYTAPEDSGNIGIEDLPRADIYGLGRCLEYLFSRGGKKKCVGTKDLCSFLKKMTNKNARLRPTALESVNFFENV